ncbi:MAG: response regulator transcription factor [Gammaproteobacteria bacterium]|nr:response regulator transcription factor [Gammaproteobacteria bacterium]
MLKILIVDDERLARVELKRLLNKIADIEIVAEASNAQDALNCLQNHSIDLVFLDIQMPGMSGLELADQIDPTVQFVFCTAFNEHAVDAFSLNATDYLMKPVNPLRLQQSIERAQQHLIAQQEQSSSLNNLTNNYLPDNHGLLLKFGDSSRIVRLSEIERFESIGNHVAVYCQSGKSYIHSSLTKIERRLDPHLFFKASRGEIIRVDSIEKIEEGMAIGSLLAVMNSGLQIEVSRRQAQSLKQLFNVW